MSEDHEPDEAPLPGIGLMRPEKDSPPELEDRIVAALYERRLLRSDPRRRFPWSIAAAAVLLLGLGFLIGRLPRPALPAVAQPRFILFLEPIPQGSEGAGSEAARVVEYRSWAGRVRQSGRTISGEKLVGGFRRVGAEGGPPRLSASEILGGYFVISARDFDDAVSVARDCPHARHGGAIVVRAIDPT
ncbi:MAG TPA: hypothetical protein VKE50_00030 [Thermoanaerobaculia bacterium]|nr:hypothetical protein [Thermoanaerobaculia bacterium]